MQPSSTKHQLSPEAQLTFAIRNARLRAQKKPCKAKLISVIGNVRQYKVTNGKGLSYFVTFEFVGNLRFGRCNCNAGSRAQRMIEDGQTPDTVCRHLPCAADEDDLIFPRRLA